MTGELINTDGFGTALIYIADKLGLTVDQMYKIYVHAQASMAITQIILICLWVVIVSITFIVTYSHLLKKNCKIDPAETVFFSFVVIIVIAVISAFVLLALYHPIIAYMCPEYTALKSLMNDIGSIIKILS
jgi:uncharacterized membrane protein YagU involved in acid resistance